MSIIKYEGLISIKPVSINITYKTNKQGSFYINQAVTKYKQEICQELRVLGFKMGNFELKGDLALTLIFGFSNSTSDTDNPLKCIQDTLAAFFRFNDSRVRRIFLDSEIVEKGKEYFFFKITEKSLTKAKDVIL